MKNRRLLLAVVLCLLVACSGSESPRRGQLMVALATDMSVPKDVTHIRVKVKLGSEVRYEDDFQLAPDGEFHIPGTVAVVEGSTPNPVVSVEVVGIRQLKSGTTQARTFAKATTTIPRERIVLMRVPVQWLCDGTAVDDGTGEYLSSCSQVDGQEASCISGTCQPVNVDSATLPTYDAALVYGGGATPTDPIARCFDTLKCFDGGKLLAPSALDKDCAFTVPDDGATLNVALEMNPGGDGICHGTNQKTPPCYVPLDHDDFWGWQLAPAAASGMRTVQLPPGVCDTLKAKRAAGVIVTTTCETKTSVYPTCGAWSSIPSSTDLGEDRPSTGGSGGADASGAGGSAGHEFAGGSAGASGPTTRAGSSGEAGTSGGGTSGGGTSGGGTSGGGTSGGGTSGGGTSGGGTSGGGTSGGSTSGGGTSGGGTSGGGTSGGSTSGSGGTAGSGTAGAAGGLCGTASIAQTAVSVAVTHTHVSVTGSMLDAAAVTKLRMDLKTFINGSTPTMPFTLPQDGPSPPGHIHTITLTAEEVTMLLANGEILGKVSEANSTGHTHTYTIGCAP